MTYRLFFYQNMVCPHESELMRALAARPDVHVTWVVDEETLPFRAKMGIGRPDYGTTTVIVTKDEARVRRIVLEPDREAIHIVGGPRAGASSRAAWRAALHAGRRVGVFAEPGDHRGLAGALRRVRDRYESARWGRRLQFVLATGALGVRWLASAGYQASRVFPFCHVTGQPGTVESTPSSRSFRIVYCGQLIERKNVEILLRALATLRDRDWECSIVGDGPLRKSLQAIAATLGIATRVSWRGVLQNSAVHHVVATHDLLVLPSAFDGWGAVVNESLAVGTPAVCTDACGAADLLADDWRGHVVPAGSPRALAEAIDARLNGGSTTPAMRERVRAWSRTRASGDVVASYFLAIMDHVYGAGLRPGAPWRARSAESSGVARSA